MPAGREVLSRGGAPWFMLDRGPLPEVMETRDEHVWEEFLACCEALDAKVRARPGDGGRANGVLRVDDVMRIAALHDRVCPVPGSWKHLYLLLTRARKPVQDRPPLPPSPLEWARTTDMQKRLRLRELAMWSQRHGALHAVHGYLCALPESSWHHLAILRWPELRLS